MLGDVKIVDQSAIEAERNAMELPPLWLADSEQATPFEGIPIGSNGGSIDSPPWRLWEFNNSTDDFVIQLRHKWLLHT